LVRIVTDTASDITAAQAAAMNIELVPLVTSFGDEVCPMSTDADYDAFYEKLRVCDKLPATGRPAPQKYIDIYERAKKAGDDVLVITLSSGLSGTYESACVAADMTGYDRVTVIDSLQAVMSQRILVEHAVKLRGEGRAIGEMIESVRSLKDRVTVVGVIGSLAYLRKGGRIPPALGILGDALGIKPVITVIDGKIVDTGKARGYKAGVAMSLKKVAADGIDTSYPVCFGYTSDRVLGEAYMQGAMERFGIEEAKLCQVNGIIGTHLGTDSVGVAYIKK